MFALPTNSATKRVFGRSKISAGRADLHESAAIEHGDPVGGRHRFGLIVGDIDRGDFEFLVQPANLEAHLFAQVRVQIAQRLVHQKNLRLHHQARAPAPPAAAGRRTARPE